MNKFLVRLSLAAALTLAMISFGSAANAQDQPSSQEPAATTPPQQQEPTTAAPEQGQEPTATTPQSQDSTTPQAQAPAQQGNDAQAQDAKSFTGQIAKEDGKVVLKDPVTKMSYQLDGQDKSASFVGKQVKVTGTLDMSSNTIHVDTIEMMQ